MKKGISKSLIVGISIAVILPSTMSLAADYSQYDIIDKDKVNKKVSITGLSAGEQFGTKIISADFNNDGKIDIAASSPFYSSKTNDWQGKVTIFWGGNYESSNKTVIYGESEGDQFGTALSSADLNNDGISDIVIGAYQADFNNINLAGKIYVFWGEDKFQSHPNKYASEAPIIYRGEQENERLGLALASGDINGDNIDDLLISAPGSLQSKAKVYGVFGKNDYPKNHIYDIQKDAGLVILGEGKELFGASLAIGDLDNDKIGDIAIGAYIADDGKKKQSGKVYLIKGRAIVAAPNKRIEYDLTVYPEIAKVLIGKQSNEWFGFDLKIHNANQDSFNDLIVGSFMYLYKNKTGKISVYQGERDFFNPEKTIQKSIQITGDNSQNLIGSSIAVGDINKDGHEELILGAPGISLVESSEPGIVYVIPELNNLSSEEYVLPKTPRSRLITGGNSDDWFGAGLEVSDLNADGIKDLIIGAPNFDSKNGYDVGNITIIYGDTSLIIDPVFIEQNKIITRGEALKKLFEVLNLKERNKNYLNSCNDSLEFCLFTFAIQSSFDKLSIPDLNLFPDVPKESEYYEYVNMATMLSIIHGYFKEDNSPFRPDYPLNRIQALKIILGSIDAVEWKYRFEVEKEIGDISAQKTYFNDINLSDTKNDWWYFRYANFAVENGIIQPGGDFKPTDEISAGEFDELLTSAKKFLQEKEETKK
ncbi:FG-GAP repeat protein [Patescibacteria group bacterium]|nr:FG-GAP repeat protein [Patescibacteria group bacterium]